MKKLAVVLLIFLLHHWTYGQDYRILQKDKDKLFISITTSGDSLLQVAIINADWRLDYVQKNFSHYNMMRAEYGDQFDSATSRPKHRLGRIGTAAEEHHIRMQSTHSFYIDRSNTTGVNGIFRVINEEYRNVTHMDDDDYKLIKHFLPDTAAEYYVDAYKGANNAAIEIMYLWGAPLRGWSIGFSITVHDREARMVLNSILCMGPEDTEIASRKIKIRQANLLAIMSYSDLFCQ